MKAVIQRCHRASVAVEGKVVGKIEKGLTVFLGIEDGDDEKSAQRLAAKIAKLRIFSDAEGRFNDSVQDVDGAILVIPNFTLCGDARKGNRPSFTSAAAPDSANSLYERFVTLLQEQGVTAERGIFGADMTVDVRNDGPVTLIIEM